MFPVTVGAGGDGLTVMVIEAQLWLACPLLLLFT
jgi:hypothetical protein